MKCSCVRSYDGDDEACYTLQEKIVTARKQHKCGECGKEINIGDNYELAKLVQDGEILTEKTCFDCLSIRNAFFCGGWYYGNILDELREHIRDAGGISEDCLSQLTPNALGVVCEMIESEWVD